jgi:hypothetical protein
LAVVVEGLVKVRRDPLAADGLPGLRRMMVWSYDCRSCCGPAIYIVNRTRERKFLLVHR